MIEIRRVWRCVGEAFARGITLVFIGGCTMSLALKESIL